MIARHIHHALAQVQELKQKVLEKQRFKGYSGRARALSGTTAFVAAWVMAYERYPQTPTAFLIGWGIVLAIAITLNYGALTYWFLFDPTVQRDLRRLKPVLEVLPPLFVGALFSLVLIKEKQFDFLYGVWMCLFGLANLATRHVLPRDIAWIGLFYIAGGTLCLLLGNISFLNPWPMGLIFFVGEWIGGVILHYDGFPKQIFQTFLKGGHDEHET
jgi:hypothetical protein